MGEQKRDVRWEARSRKSAVSSRVSGDIMVENSQSPANQAALAVTSL